MSYETQEEPLGGYKFVHEDGLLDLVISAGLFIFGLSIVAEATLIGLIIIILLIPVWESTKRSVTLTRMMEPVITQEQKQGLLQTRQLLRGLTAVLFTLGLLWLWTRIDDTLPAWLYLPFSHLGVLLLGLLGTAVWFAAAHLNQIYRYYNHALLTFAAFTFGYAFNIPLAYILILLGGVIGVAGIILLHQFMRNHPPTIDFGFR